jgi:CHASE3 domain sensor protein
MSSGLKLKYRILLGYSMPVLIMLVAAGLTYSGIQRSNEASREVEHQSQTLVLYKTLLETALGNESGFRIFIITGREDLLEQMAFARRRFDETMNELKKRAVDPRQLKRLEDIEEIMHDKIIPFQSPIIDLRKEGTEESLKKAAARTAAGVGPELFREMRDRVEEAVRNSELPLEESRQKDSKAKSAVLLIVFLGTGIGAAIAMVAALFISSGIVRSINEAVAAITTSSTEIASTVEEHERTATQQSSAVNETTTTMDELGASSRQSAEQAETASTGARQALTLAEEGTKTVKQTLGGMASLREKVGAVAEQILRLSEQTGQIGNITSLVSDLANQTNLLALNAAVEAARAGEHGKGFAVVAVEIRKLADQSKKSAERINTLVADIQKATNSTVMVTEEGTKTVEEGTQLAQKTAGAFNGLAATINSTFESVQQIALNVKQQAAATNQVVEAMGAINAGARETAAGIAQTKVGIAKLNQAALGLQAMV